MLSLTKTAAREWAHIPIRCNVMSPGFTKTDMLAATDKEIIEDQIKMIPMQRMAEPKGNVDVISHSVLAY